MVACELQLDGFQPASRLYVHPEYTLEPTNASYSSRLPTAVLAPCRNALSEPESVLQFRVEELASWSS